MAAIRRRYACAITAALVVAMVGAAACGGKASDTSGSGGTGAASGAGGSGNASGAGGSGNASGAGAGGVCAMGAPCSQPGSVCTPDECCPCTFTCESGTWTAQGCPACEAPMCPAAPPSDAAPCDACDQLLGTCSYGSCQTTGSGTSATCVGKQWQVVHEACPVPPPCGPGFEPCPSGTLCVQFGGFGDTPKCLPNPCAPGQAVTCECAGGLCTYGYCAEANAESVICECPNC